RISTNQLAQGEPGCGHAWCGGQATHRRWEPLLASQYPRLVIIVLCQEPGAPAHEDLCIPIEVQIRGYRLAIVKLKVRLEALEFELTRIGWARCPSRHGSRMGRDSVQ